MQQLDRLVDLKKIVNEMERDLGLNSLSAIEQNVLLAISDLQKTDGIAKTKSILSHNLTTKISRPSVFRTLNKLEEYGKLKKNSFVGGQYSLA